MMEDDDNLWECPVCLDRMQEIGFAISDTVNPCTHAFCMACTRSLQESAQLKSTQLICPICRRDIHGFVINTVATTMIGELDKCKDMLREMREKERDTHRRERKLAQDYNAGSLRIAHLEGELTKAVSDMQCEVDRNEHLRKMCNLVEMEKETLSERLQDLQKKLQAELEESTRRIGIMENEVSDYQHQLRITANEVAKAENENNELRGLLRENEARLSRIQEEKRSADIRISDLEGEATFQNSEMMRVQSEHETAINEMRARMSHEVRKVQSDHEAAQEDLRNKIQNSALFEKRSRDLESKANILEAELRRVREEAVRADRRASELDSTVKRTEVEKLTTGQLVQQLEAMLGTYKAEVKTLEREKFECAKKSAELEGTLARMKSDAQKVEEERISMKERIWKAERDMEVMRRDRDKMRSIMKEREDKQNDSYLGGWMKNLKPISNVIWGEHRVYGPLVKNFNDFMTLERRGGRKDGRVWRCKAKLTGSYYALKSLPTSVLQNSQGSADLTVFREAMLLKTMNHPNIISIEGIYRDSKDGNLNMLLSPFIEIDLDYSVGQKTMNAMEIKNLTYQMLLAIEYMHKNDIVHRNIKPTNILRFEDYTLKLCGFTYARSVQNQTADMIVPKPPIWFSAPEVLKAQSSIKAQIAIDWKAVDMWAVGCVLAEMLLQKPLFAGTQDHIQNITSILGAPMNDSAGKLYPDPNSNSLASALAKSPYASHPSFRSAAALVRSLLVFDTQNRITASQALQHEYLSEFQVRKETRVTSDISREVQDSNLPRFVENDCGGLLV